MRKPTQPQLNEISLRERKLYTHAYLKAKSNYVIYFTFYFLPHEGRTFARNVNLIFQATSRQYANLFVFRYLFTVDFVLGCLSNPDRSVYIMQSVLSRYSLLCYDKAIFSARHVPSGHQSCLVLLVNGNKQLSVCRTTLQHSIAYYIILYYIILYYIIQLTPLFGLFSGQSTYLSNLNYP